MTNILFWISSVLMMKNWRKLLIYMSHLVKPDYFEIHLRNGIKINTCLTKNMFKQL